MDGWHFQLDGVRENLAKTLATDKALLRELENTFAIAINTANKVRGPGASALMSSRKQVTDASKEWVNNIEDYLDEVSVIQAELDRNKDNNKIVDALTIYALEANRVFETNSKPSFYLDLEAGWPVASLEIPLPSALRSQRVVRSRLEDMLHTSIANIRPEAIGRVALSYSYENTAK